MGLEYVIEFDLTESEHKIIFIKEELNTASMRNVSDIPKDCCFIFEHTDFDNNNNIMTKLCKLYSDVLFTLTAYNNSDSYDSYSCDCNTYMNHKGLDMYESKGLWIKYFKNGKYQYEEPEVVVQECKL